MAASGGKDCDGLQAKAVAPCSEVKPAEMAGLLCPCRYEPGRLLCGKWWKAERPESTEKQVGGR